MLSRESVTAKKYEMGGVINYANVKMIRLEYWAGN
jgi:hypothetical protein